MKQQIHIEQEPDLGPCCICGGTEAVHYVLMLEKRAPIPGRGWGCLQCGLPKDGAIAVLCEGCLAGNDATALKFACRGYPGEDGRIAIGELPEGTFVHDRAKHPELGEPCNCGADHGLS